MTTTSIENRDWPMSIGGEWVRTQAIRKILLPYDGTIVAEVYDADPATVEQAIGAAENGAAAMRNLPQYERAELLDRMRRLLERDSAEFAQLICMESGKPIREARLEAERSQQTLLASADAARQLRGEVIPMEAFPSGKGRWAMTVREPLGIIAAITPFNFPLNLALHKVGPAFAGGNSVIHKPSGNTPLSALRLARLIQEAGAPDGAYNVITGSGQKIGAQIVQDPRVAMVTFTGSVPVGTDVRAGVGLRRATLELGSNSSVIIESDADLKLILPRCVTGSFSHSGQVCISVQNIYVQERIADDFTAHFIEATRALKIGHPFEETTDISSLISVAEAERVESLIRNARAAGAHILTGGNRRHATIDPTILADAPADSIVSCKEAFGPIVVLHRYRALEDAIANVNSSEYGLQAGLCTRDIEKAFRASQLLHVGGVIVNDVPAYRADHMPYGGVKNSGIGREGPRFAVEEMTEMKLICWR